jgi:hypothetical protein
MPTRLREQAPRAVLAPESERPGLRYRLAVADRQEAGLAWAARWHVGPAGPGGHGCCLFSEGEPGPPGSLAWYRVEGLSPTQIGERYEVGQQTAPTWLGAAVSPMAARRIHQGGHTRRPTGSHALSRQHRHCLWSAELLIGMAIARLAYGCDPGRAVHRRCAGPGRGGDPSTRPGRGRHAWPNARWWRSLTRRESQAAQGRSVAGIRLSPLPPVAELAGMIDQGAWIAQTSTRLPVGTRGANAEPISSGPGDGVRPDVLTTQGY